MSATQSGMSTRYPSEQKLEALTVLVANNANVLATSRLLGIPQTTLRDWADAATGELGEELARIRDRKKSELAMKFEQAAELLLDHAVERADSLSGKDAMIASAIAVDKALLLRGQATSITEHRDDERLRLLAERYAQLQRVSPITVAPIKTPVLPPAAEAAE